MEPSNTRRERAVSLPGLPSGTGIDEKQHGPSVGTPGPSGVTVGLRAPLARRSSPHTLPRSAAREGPR